MEWLNSLFFSAGTSGSVGVAHSVLILALVISIGILLGKVKIAGISLGVTWILFVGILFSHFGMRLNGTLLHFVQEFGLILFVYSVGLQVGPGFFSSLKKGGIQLNMLACSIVLMGVVATYVIYKLTGLPITTMVGIMSGAVTNTPGLGAAQQANHDLIGADSPDIAMGYAIAYPLAVVGIVVTIIGLRYFFNINMEKEEKAALSTQGGSKDEPRQLSLRLGNPALNGKKVGDIHDLINRNYVISRIRHKDGTVEIARPETLLYLGDEMLVVTSSAATPAITAFIGEEVNVQWMNLGTQLISRRILITKSELNGKSLEQLRVRSLGVSITRVNRSGVDLVAYPSLRLQIGDRLTVVGTEPAIVEVEKKLGNSLKRLNAPNLFPLFLGIFLGVILGSIPVTFSGIPQPVKLGLAGGPLVVSILISHFGPKFKLVTYTTMSANLMLREVGIALFLACVGLGAGERFIDTVIAGGYKWIGYGALITLIPIILAGIVGRLFMKLNYCTLSGLIAGAMTDPPALAYANEAAGNDLPSVGYATVYPLTMFLRVLSAQLLILLLT
ncbi:MAG: putative transporter [Prevotellaceae bacterium]|jgi:putative transport protein|nr:putative transporter [Prevotellaceae bacterium]